MKPINIVLKDFILIQFDDVAEILKKLIIFLTELAYLEIFLTRHTVRGTLQLIIKRVMLIDHKGVLGILVDLNSQFEILLDSFYFLREINL